LEHGKILIVVVIGLVTLVVKHRAEVVIA
jgi:hypothetical protein